MEVVRAELYTIPTWAEYYFSTGETTDMTEEEIELADSWYKARKLKGSTIIVDEKSPSFSWSNDMNNIGGDVVETTFLFFED
jgi:hypothetical protein